MSNNLPAFDETAICSKCHFTEVSVRFCNVTTRYWHFCHQFKNLPLEGHLHRKCERCGYEWVETTVDACPSEHHKKYILENVLNLFAGNELDFMITRREGGFEVRFGGRGDITVGGFVEEAAGIGSWLVQKAQKKYGPLQEE